MKTNYEINNNIATIKINKEIFSKEIIIQTTYILLEKFYFLIDSDKNYFIVEMKSKDKPITEKDVLKFFDEIIESQSYIDQLKRTSKIREIILEKALITQTTK